MWFTRHSIGGVLIGLAFGIFVGAGVTQGKKEVNTASMAGVGILLAVTGMATVRSGVVKS